MDFTLKQSGLGFIIGFCVGFALKKGLKVLSFLMFLGLVLFFTLDYFGLYVQKEVFLDLTQGSKGYFDYVLNALKTRIAYLDYIGGISGIIGFIAGYKLG